MRKPQGLSANSLADPRSLQGPGPPSIPHGAELLETLCPPVSPIISCQAFLLSGQGLDLSCEILSCFSEQRAGL